jgi:amino-acid N-acetyltransferase
VHALNIFRATSRPLLFNAPIHLSSSFKTVQAWKMTTSMLASGKVNAFGALKKSVSGLAAHESSRHFGNAAGARNNGKPVVARMEEDAQISRELFMDVLTANATKRDAKQYLSRFDQPKPLTLKHSAQDERNARHRRDQDRVDRMGVNLGGLYAPARAIANTPQFVREEVREKVPLVRKTLHTALVSLRSPENLSDELLDGLAATLSQLVRLDMRILLAIDCVDLGEAHYQDLHARRRMLSDQGDRLVKAISQHSPEGARYICDAITCADIPDSLGETGASVGLPSLLLHPLKRGVVVIVPTIAYSESGHLTSTSLAETMRALTAQLAGQGVEPIVGRNTEYPDPVSLDRIIMLDPAGGIPSKDRGDGTHIFINLEQEFDMINKELSDGNVGPHRAQYRQHQANLDISRQCLTMLPSASSALIITPEEAAISSRGRTESEPIRTGTRQQKNTLIHNLLTNKPMVSSSLPLERLPSASGSHGSSATTSSPAATLVKKGMPLTIIPSADRWVGWTAPKSGRTAINLREDPRINFPRLVALIENSFRRKIDVEHYLNRIAGRTAGIIVAGDYEGGAILTWEQAPGSNDPTQLVPYLDKFAVLQTSQGSAGVADIVFQAMARTCFPHGVCWRSRNDNPVNKWYFERASGTWTIPNSNWTMFWTGEGVVEDQKKWEEYVGVCTSVMPSWADKGQRPD